MKSPKESAPTVESRGAKHEQSISQVEFERGCRAIVAAFALMVALYAIWEVSS